MKAVSLNTPSLHVRKCSWLQMSNKWGGRKLSFKTKKSLNLSSTSLVQLARIKQSFSEASRFHSETSAALGKSSCVMPNRKPQRGKMACVIWISRARTGPSTMPLGCGHLTWWLKLQTFSLQSFCYPLWYPPVQSSLHVLNKTRPVIYASTVSIPPALHPSFDSSIIYPPYVASVHFVFQAVPPLDYWTGLPFSALRPLPQFSRGSLIHDLANKNVVCQDNWDWCWPLEALDCWAGLLRRLAQSTISCPQRSIHQGNIHHKTVWKETAL